MLRLKLLLFTLLSVSCALRVMTINMYGYGRMVNNGVKKTANQIKNQNPDIVALQDVGNDKQSAVTELIGYLGNGWSAVSHCNGWVAAVTRHKILSLYEHVTNAVNARIQLRETGQEISFWSVDLPGEYFEYGPFAAVNGVSLEKLLQGEKSSGRVGKIVELIRHNEFVQQIKNSDNTPVIVAGTLGTPSHQDWVSSAKHLHHNYIVDWPVTKLLTEAAGMTDSFREVNPDPKSNPGLTWSIYKYHNHKEIRQKDRVDYIFYRGSLRPTKSQTFAGTSPNVVDELHNAKWKENEWPSSHWAVITDFEHTYHKCENKPSFFIDSEYLTGSIHAIPKCALKIIQ